MFYTYYFREQWLLAYNWFYLSCCVECLQVEVVDAKSSKSLGKLTDVRQWFSELFDFFLFCTAKHVVLGVYQISSSCVL